MYAKWKTFPLTVSCLKIKFRLKGKLCFVYKHNCFTVPTERLMLEEKLRKCKVYSIVVLN